MKNRMALVCTLLLSSPLGMLLAGDEWQLEFAQDMCEGVSGDAFWEAYPSEVISFEESLLNQEDSAQQSSSSSGVSKISTKILLEDKGLSGDELKRLSNLLESLQPDIFTLLSQPSEKIVEQLQEKSNSLVVYEASAAHLALGLLYYGNSGVLYDSHNAMHHLQEAYRHIGVPNNEWYCFCPTVLCLMGLLYARDDHFYDNQDHRRAFECFALAHQAKKALFNRYQHQQEAMELINKKIHDVSTWASAQVYTPWFLAFDGNQAELGDTSQRYKLRIAGLLLNKDLYLMWAATHGDAEAAYKLACDIQEKDVEPYYNRWHQNMNRGIPLDQQEYDILCTNAGKAMKKFEQARKNAQQELAQCVTRRSSRFNFENMLQTHRRARLDELNQRAESLVETLQHLPYNLEQQQ